MSNFVFIVLLIGGMAWALMAKKLTLMASLTGGLLATTIFIGVGWIGVALLGAFFLLGTLATSWRKNVKQSLGLAQENMGRRNAGQVLANAGIAGIFGLLAIIFPDKEMFFLYLMAAGFSSATADTLSSELGSVYGKQFYDIISFRKGQRGLDGVISIEGTLMGIFGSLLIAVIYAVGLGWNEAFYWIVVSGTIGNLTDSYLGATLERKGKMSNDTVNFLNTLAAVGAASLFYGL